MADASAVKFAIMEETTFGVNPDALSHYFRTTGDTLKGTQQNVTSAEIDSTRQPAGSQRVNFFAEGSLAYEMSHAGLADPPLGYEMLAEGAFMNDWQTIEALTGETITIGTPTAGNFDVTSASTDAFANVNVGDWIKLGGFATNTTGIIYCNVVSKTGDDDINCDGVQQDGTAVVAEAGTANETVDASRLTISTTKKSYTIVKEFTDLTTPEYQEFTGMRVGTWTLTLTPQQLFTGEFGFTGKVVDTATADPITGTPTAKWSTTRLQAVDHFKNAMEGVFTAETAERVTEISFSLNNGLRTEPELGVSGSTDIGISTPTMTGTLTAYMTTGALARKLEDNTSSKIAFRLTNGLNLGARRDWIVSLPLIRYTDASVLATGNDQSVLAQMEWSAEPDANGNGPAIFRF